MAGLLTSSFSWVIMAKNGASVEAVFPVLQDGKRTAAYGGTVFLINACYDKTATVNSNGTAGCNLYENANWAGVRARKDLIDKFFPNNNAPSVTGAVMPHEAGDDRALFDGVGRTLHRTLRQTFCIYKGSSQ